MGSDGDSKTELSDAAPGQFITIDGVTCFSPDPLPSTLTLSEETQRVVETVASAVETHVAEFEETATVDHRDDLIWSEARASSAIENIPEPYSTIALDPETGRIRVPAIENLDTALKDALSAVESPSDITLSLLSDLHQTLLEGVYQGRGEVGSYRDHLVAVGSGDDRFVPPPSAEISGEMGALGVHLQTETDNHWLVDTALCHYQFETIHPYVDGNGRLGRLLSVLQSVAHTEATSLCLTPSAYLSEYRSDYFAGLRAVSHQGEWDEWVRFFVKAFDPKWTDRPET